LRRGRNNSGCDRSRRNGRAKEGISHRFQVSLVFLSVIE
jgi:hypothetical protein